MVEWRDVVGHEGYYQISSDGQIKSMPRFIIDKRIGKKKHRGGLMKPAAGGYKKRYLVIPLRTKGKPKMKLIHRLVAQAFIPNPNNYETVNHIDGNQRNNHVSNLEWASGAQNSRHYWDTCGKKRGVSMHKGGLYRMRMNIRDSKAICEYFKNKNEAYQCYFDTYKEWYGKKPW